MTANGFLRIVLISCCLCCSLPSISVAGPERIRVVMDNNYPPFVFKDNAGNPQGSQIDLWRLWEKKTGVKVEITLMDWAAAQRRLQADEFDVIDKIAITEQRSKIYDFSAPFSKIDVSAFFMQDISGITDVASLKGFAIGVQRGDSAVEFLNGNGVYNLVQFNNYEEIVLAAKEHKVNVMVMDKAPALYFLHKHDMLHNFKQSAPLTVITLHRAVRKGNTELLSTVEDGFRLITPDELKKIETKWYGASLGGRIPVVSILAGAGALCLLVLVLFVWNRSLNKAVNTRTAELQAAKQRFQAIYNFVNDAIFIHDVESGAIVDVNQRMCEMFGCSKEQAITLPVDAFSAGTSPYSQSEAVAWMSKAAQGESQIFEWLAKTISGEQFWVEVNMRRARIGLEDRILVTSRDISERKEVEEALRESEERLRVIFEASESGIILVNPQGVIDFANRRMSEMCGMPHDELIGTPYSALLCEEEKIVADERMFQLIRGEIKSVVTERHYLRKDGTDFWGYLSGRRLENPDGTLRSLVGVISDITERKKAEEERLNLERQLLHSQKLESLGILSGGIAHDFNNLLLAVLGNLDLALMKLPEEATARKNIGQAISASRHAAKLTNMMLAYSGKGNFIVNGLNLTELMEENSAMLSAAISKTIKLDLHLDQSLPLIMADAGQLQQVVMNLITNASEAIGDVAGSITLSTGVHRFDQVTLDGSRLEEKLPAGRYVWMEVSDTGCGMDEETLHKLFDPFFTTKFTGRGLGMSAVLGIIRAHKGAFLVESRPSAGTTIRVLFPIADIPRAEQTNTTVASLEPVTPAAMAGAVLIVDDEEIVRVVCADLLDGLGFETIAAADGEEALRIFREQGDRICLVLLDQLMPGMDGVAVFRELRRIRPDIRVLLSSGFSEQEVSERFKGLGLDGFIQKPFNQNLLADELRRVLGDAG